MPTLLHHLLLAADPGIFAPSSEALAGEGWSGFTDIHFLLVFIGRLALATALAVALAYHPKATHRYKSVSDVNAPKTYILYALVAAIIGTAVLKFGGMVGFVIFGIGGLFRFRTNVGSATQTGRVILVTVIGLCAGLDLPHVAILSALFAFILVWIIDGRTTHCLVIMDLHKKDLDQIESAYKDTLKTCGCRIIGQDRNRIKHSLKILFRAPNDFDRDEMMEACAEKLPEKHPGTVEWES
jgi:hypothetical protein